MNSRRTRTGRWVIIGTVAVLAIGAAVVARDWLANRYIHDYASKRQPRPEVLRLSNGAVHEALEHAFDFRVMEVDGRQRFAFNSGLCLLAHRAKTGEEISWTDRLIQQAVLNLWQEPWMKEFSNAAVADLHREFGQTVVSATSVPTDATADRMTAKYVQSLREHPSFESAFRSSIEIASKQLDVGVVWSDPKEGEL